MLEELRKQVFEANLELNRKGLVVYTWGNVSGIDRGRGLVVIKPSGVDYETMTADQMVVVTLDGETVEGSLRPSSDLPTHLELYRRFPNIGGVAHTHSPFATAWAQAGMEIPCLGTTHADHFYGPVPCARALTQDEVEHEYEHNTGKVIVEAFAGLDPDAVPAVLVSQHGPFTWGKDPMDAVKNSVVLEEVAKMASVALGINPYAKPVPQYLLDKHYFRKHGKNAYYGQV
ncbi:MAG: L-ribulose-5-phosphate 4-epimerase [Limnochordia bacterium]|nr:L-ribulose-5-phosphate 4-epimerase [Bacillota bacterium]HOB08190.1 L-ribulose-5-phosphate 4-epimerase [Limnochordia bacterium]HPT92305.1 L-ribulose-5-phosphate 4-epimerase [Limnochordia bacterium]HPZ30317.1 L-ribulose-5-phosphate 4-epimerase [Limnochordia bacterium]HQD69873.1 L-ribulose-5-phosphate 4-epimerase [Limnochordia bacterium]